MFQLFCFRNYITQLNYYDVIFPWKLFLDHKLKLKLWILNRAIGQVFTFQYIWYFKVTR